AALPRSTAEQPLQILEVGAGLGSTVERLCASGMLTHAGYTAIDMEPALIAEARRWLPQWAAAQGWQVRQDSQERIHMQRPGQDTGITTEASDGAHFFARERGHGTGALLFARAFLAWVDVPTSFPAPLSLLQPGGLFFCPIPFDGGTVLQ